ncbi:hypothetical protein NKH49_12125 [Mesorhizobium sp. M1088]|uniref:hypothetical protein n=1 Tax=Mesorhizobium sp. M1088 TaxID=2957056 RepID=UPI00333A425D
MKRGLAPSGQTVVTPRFSWRIAPVRKAAATSSFDTEPDLQTPRNAGRIRIRMSQPCVRHTNCPASEFPPFEPCSVEQIENWLTRQRTAKYGTDVGRFLADVDRTDRKMIVALVRRYICKQAIDILSMTFGCSPFSALGKTGEAK